VGDINSVHLLVLIKALSIITRNQSYTDLIVKKKTMGIYL